MRAQVNRIGEAWEYLEKNVLAGTVSNSGAVYKERGLKTEWLGWMEAGHKARLDGLVQALDKKLSIFEGKPGVVTRVKRWDFAGIFGREVKTPNCGFEKDATKMAKRVELLVNFKKKSKR